MWRSAATPITCIQSVTSAPVPVPISIPRIRLVYSLSQCVQCQYSVFNAMDDTKNNRVVMLYPL